MTPAERSLAQRRVDDRYFLPLILSNSHHYPDMLLTETMSMIVYQSSICFDPYHVCMYKHLVLYKCRATSSIIFVSYPTIYLFPAALVPIYKRVEYVFLKKRPIFCTSAIAHDLFFRPT